MHYTAYKMTLKKLTFGKVCQILILFATLFKDGLVFTCWEKKKMETKLKKNNCCEWIKSPSFFLYICSLHQEEPLGQELRWNFTVSIVNWGTDRLAFSQFMSKNFFLRNLLDLGLRNYWTDTSTNTTDNHRTCLLASETLTHPYR